MNQISRRFTENSDTPSKLSVSCELFYGYNVVLPNCPPLWAEGDHWKSAYELYRAGLFRWYICRPEWIHGGYTIYGKYFRKKTAVAAMVALAIAGEKVRW